MNWSGFCSFEEVSHVVFRLDVLTNYLVMVFDVFSCLHFMPLWFDEYFKDFVSFRFLSFLSLNNLTSFFLVVLTRSSTGEFVFVGVRWRFAFAFSVPDSAFCDVQCLKITKMSHVNFQFAKNKNNSVCHRGLSHLQVLKKFGVKIQIFCLKSLVSGWTF